MCITYLPERQWAQASILFNKVLNHQRLDKFTPEEFKDLYNLAIEEAELNDLYNEMTELLEMMEQAASSISITTETLWLNLISALKRQWLIVNDDLLHQTHPAKLNGDCPDHCPTHVNKSKFSQDLGDQFCTSFNGIN